MVGQDRAAIRGHVSLMAVSDVPNLYCYPCRRCQVRDDDFTTNLLDSIKSDPDYQVRLEALGLPQTS